VSDRPSPRLTPVSILFFLWGFAYALVGSLSVQIQNLLGYPPSRTIALHAAYWGAYFVGPLLVGHWVLKREGFKATFMTGLAIFATGALSFWPSSVLRSYAGFFISNFIIALGISCLEVAANLFIALAGPGELSEARLNFAQGLNGIGATLSPIVAQVALFAGIDQLDLFRVQWCYFTIALFAVFLAIIFYYVPLSEAGDDDLEAMALQRLYNAGLDPRDKAFGIGARHLLLWSGVLALWFYGGNRESVFYFWTSLVQGIKPGYDPFWSLTIGRSLFTFGRFLAAGLYFVGCTPRITIGVFMLGAFVTSVLALVLPLGSGALGILLLYCFFEGPVFPTYFAMIMRSQGKHTKFAAATTITTISGFALWPSVVYGIQQQQPAFSRSAFLVVVILFGLSTLWPVILSSRSVLRRWVDPIWSKQRATESGEHGRGSSVSRYQTALTPHLEEVAERSSEGTGRPEIPSRPARKPSVSIVT
jgi:fucose permease